MSGWITVGLGAAAALCPLPGHTGTAATIDTTPTTAHLVVCAADTWVEITTPAGPPAPKTPVAVPPSAPAVEQAPRAVVPPAHPEVAVRPRPGPPATPSSPAAVRRPPAVEPPAEADELPTTPEADAPAPRPAPGAAAFRWVPRFHYGGRPARPAPAGLSAMTTTVVITTPAVLAAAALRPGSRRRGNR
ncbi:hypothetical protein ABZT03_36275 [Streptomyces sp. NPDC005574]|uniref:hypothetical protein n=1 Tax=Streptomyces sp. NPDC005574 TaxID=3156891 RepID=UPI0033AEEDB5